MGFIACLDTKINLWHFFYIVQQAHIWNPNVCVLRSARSGVWDRFQLFQGYLLLDVLIFTLHI